MFYPVHKTLLRRSVHPWEWKLSIVNWTCQDIRVQGNLLLWHMQWSSFTNRKFKFWKCWYTCIFTYLKILCNIYLINIFINSAHALHIIILFYIFNNYCPVCFSMKKIQIHRFYVVIMDKKQQHVSRKLCSLSFCFIYVISNYMQGNLINSILCNRIII